jgi:exodeoxyribonuclease VII large subunit
MDRPRATFIQGKAQDSLSVGQLLALAKNLLEESFLGLWVEGEVANYRPAASGHWYFSLKDGTAEMKVAMFRGRNLYAAVAPENGMKVRLRGRLTIYEARGELQMVAEQIEDAGAGAAARTFEILKAKLAAEGLFDAQRKRALPKMPRRIALLSSSTGAAVHDFLTVLARRFPLSCVEIWPVLVQGELAAAQITAALQGIAKLFGRYDVVVLTRGGGSAQDLACFNDEALVRAVAASAVPVISAVGHEIDVTLCDFAADLRAATPTAAAELASPDQFKLRADLQGVRLTLRRLIAAAIEPRQQQLDYSRRLLDAHAPQARLNGAIDRLNRALSALQRQGLNARSTQFEVLGRLQNQLAAHHPSLTIASAQSKLSTTISALTLAAKRNIDGAQHRLALAAASLSGLSPARTLERGYVLVRALDGPGAGQWLQSAKRVPVPGKISLRFYDGDVSAWADGVDGKAQAFASKSATI